MSVYPTHEEHENAEGSKETIRTMVESGKLQEFIRVDFYNPDCFSCLHGQPHTLRQHNEAIIRARG